MDFVTLLPSEPKSHIQIKVAMPRLLSLFDGTGSIARPFTEAGWDVSRLDISGKHGADIVCDILKWDYTSEPTPDVIFAGPCCTHYSIARSNAKTPRNFELADSLVRATWEIIAHFKAVNRNLLFFIENPSTSLLWKRSVSDPFPDRITLDYCQYKSIGFRKRTIFATNSTFVPRALCNPKTCPNCEGGVHIISAQQRPGKVNGVRRTNDRVTLDQLHAYPAELCNEFCQYCDSHVRAYR